MGRGLAELNAQKWRSGPGGGCAEGTSATRTNGQQRTENALECHGMRQLDTQENAPRFSVFPTSRCSELCGQNAWISSDPPPPPSFFILFKERRLRAGLGAGDGGEVRGGCMAQRGEWRAGGPGRARRAGRAGRALWGPCSLRGLRGAPAPFSQLRPHQNHTKTWVKTLTMTTKHFSTEKAGAWHH